MLASSIVMGQTSSSPKMIYKKIIDEISQNSFSVPEDAVITHPDNMPNAGNAFLVNKKTMAQVEWSGMVAKISSFDVEYNFNHADWLYAFAENFGIKARNLRTVVKPSGLVLGIVEYTIAEDSSDKATAYLAIAGKRGYLMSGQGPWSDPLVEAIASSITVSGGKWGEVDDLSTLFFADHDLDFRSDFHIEDASSDESIIKNIYNARKIADSTIILALKTGVNRIHPANIRRFKKNLSDLKFKAKLIQDKNQEAVFELISYGGKSYAGFMTTTKSGVSVSLIVPFMTDDPNAWLSGKYYYIRTLQALK